MGKSSGKNAGTRTGKLDGASRALVPATAGELAPLTWDRQNEEPIVETGPPPVLTTSPTPWMLLVALRRRWVLALMVGLVAGVLGSAATWYFLPTTWRARTVLHISSNQPFVIFPSAEARSEFANYQRSQLFLVRSRLVLNAALRDREVSSLPVVQMQLHPVEWLEKELKVDFASGSEIMNIGMTGDDPDAMTKLVNAVRDAYLKEIVNKEQNERLRKLDQLQKLYGKYDDLLRDKRQKLKELAVALGSPRTEGVLLKQKYIYDHLEFLQREMVQLQSQTRKLRIGYQNTQAKHNGLKESDIPLEAVEERLKQHPDIVKLQTSITTIQDRIKSLREALREPESDARVIAETKALASAQETLAARRKELRPTLNRQYREEFLAHTGANLLTQKEQMQGAEKLESLVQEQLDKKSKEIKTLEHGGPDLEYLQTEIAQSDETHKKVGAQKEHLQVEIEAPSRVSILEDGFALQTRDPASRLYTAGLSGAGLLGLVLFGVAFLEFRSRRVNSLGEIAHGLGLPLVGVLPRMPARAMNRNVKKRANDHWEQLLAESVHATRAMLVHAAKHESLRVVMVSSAVKGEGKTLVSSNLAVSMALAGFKTLLIDADLRCSSLYHLFDLPAGPGLSELLREKADLESVLHSELLPGLSVITAGQWHNSLVRLLAQPRLGTVLEELKKSFDFIIIDSAPVLPATDTLLIAQHMDGVLLSILCDVSRLPMVHLAQERLAMLGTRILGAVVGGARFDNGYGYNYSPYGPPPEVEPTE